MSDLIGIIRRMDTQGRVTIPPGVQRILDIVPGDPLEIHVSSGEIRLKKYSLLQAMLKQGYAHIKALDSIYGAKCMICDTEQVITANGGQKTYTMIGQRLSVLAAKKLRQDKDYVPRSHMEMFAPVDASHDIMAGAIVPLHSDGLLCGGMILCVQSGCVPTETQINALRYAANVLDRQYR